MGKSPKTSGSRVWLKITQKKEILKFHEENPGYSYRKLAETPSNSSPSNF